MCRTWMRIINGLSFFFLHLFFSTRDLCEGLTRRPLHAAAQYELLHRLPIKYLCTSNTTSVIRLYSNVQRQNNMHPNKWLKNDSLNFFRDGYDIRNYSRPFPCGFQSNCLKKRFVHNAVSKIILHFKMRLIYLTRAHTYIHTCIATTKYVWNSRYASRRRHSFNNLVSLLARSARTRGR